MPHTNFEPSKTMFGTKLQEALDAKGLQIRDASDLVGMTYEYMRKLVRGPNLPSKYVLQSICAKLGMNQEEMTRIVAADRIQWKTGGDMPEELTGFDPELEPFRRGWTKLNKSQKEHLLATLKTFLTQNRKHTA